MPAARAPDDQGRYRCTTCGEWLPPDAFSVSRKHTSGRASRCRTCTAIRAKAARTAEPDRFRGYRKPRRPEVAAAQNARRRAARAANPAAYRSGVLRRYGLTVAAYEALVEQQDGRCLICRTVPDYGKGKRLHVDHHHATGHVRALLCTRCNVMIGYAKENPDVLRAAADYLATYSHSTCTRPVGDTSNGSR